MINSDPKLKTQLIVEYLKIRLAGQNGGAFGTSLSIGAIPLSHAIRALCAHYLAEIFKMAKTAARAAFPSELAAGRTVKWFANVGVPVKHYDSETLSVFREVVRVAWAWHEEFSERHDRQ